MGLILLRTFTPVSAPFFLPITTPAAISALQLSLLVVAIVVPLNVCFWGTDGLVAGAQAISWQGLLQAVIDLPFAVSPVVVGVALILLWAAPEPRFVENDLGVKIIFGCPASCWRAFSSRCPSSSARWSRSCTSWAPSRSRPPDPRRDLVAETFWRITLPSIRWGLTYGIVLTVARTLGEYGAVLMVSSNMPGKSQTLTLLVSDRYNRGQEYGAYAISRC